MMSIKTSLYLKPEAGMRAAEMMTLTFSSARNAIIVKICCVVHSNVILSATFVFIFGTTDFLTDAHGTKISE